LLAASTPGINLALEAGAQMIVFVFSPFVIFDSIFTIWAIIL